MWFWKIMVRFFMSLDSVLFNFISELYDLLIAISRTSILTQGDIAQFAGRIELLLGIFMLFKLSFSLITYIVNPEDFSDKSKGFGKLIQSAVVSLVMLILVPYIFQMAYSLQAKILDDNLLAKLILGENLTNSENKGGETNNATVIDEAGDIMAFQVMLPFFKPRVSVAGLTDCVNLYKDKEFNEACKNALHDAGLTGYNLDNYVYGIENNSLGLTFRVNTALQTTGEGDNEQFVIDYMYPISTVVAVVVCLLLVTFCIDIGLRSVKLAFLQLIYPIPVIAYMDPKAGKDGIFKKWYQMCISTFLSLFIRLIALYFGVYIIAKVADFGMYDIINGSQITNGFVVIFVIIGVLMFVKQLPKILENLGIKLDGDGKFSLNPLKKLEDGMIGGKKILGAGQGVAAAGLLGAAAMGSNLLTAGSRIKNANGFRGKSRAVLGSFGGALSAARKGLVGGIKGEKFGKNFSDSYSAAMNEMKREQERADEGIGKMGVNIAKAQKKMGVRTAGERAKQTSETIKKIQEKYDQIKNTAIATDEGAGGAKELSKKLEAMKRSAPSYDNCKAGKVKDEKGNEVWLEQDEMYRYSINKYNEALNEVESQLDDRINAIANGTVKIKDKDNHENIGANITVASLAKEMKDLSDTANREGHKLDPEFATNTIKTGKAKTNYGTARGAGTQLDSSEKVQKAYDVDRYADSGKK